MSRSLKKGPFVDEKLLLSCEKAISASQASGKKSVIKTRSRGSFILPDFVGLVIGVYDGKKTIKLSINEDMVGHKLGEFVPTRKYCVHKGNRK